MPVVRVVVNGFALMAVNFMGIGAGFMAYYAIDRADQIAVQVPVAVLLSILLFTAWALILGRTRFRNLSLRTNPEFVWAFVLSLIWAPAMFVPLHYLTQGYLTSAGNIISLVGFQLPANTLACLVAYKVARPGGDRSLSLS